MIKDDKQIQHVDTLLVYSEMGIWTRLGYMAGMEK